MEKKNEIGNVYLISIWKSKWIYNHIFPLISLNVASTQARSGVPNSKRSSLRCTKRPHEILSRQSKVLRNLHVINFQSHPFFFVVLVLTWHLGVRWHLHKFSCSCRINVRSFSRKRFLWRFKAVTHAQILYVLVEWWSRFGSARNNKKRKRKKNSVNGSNHSKAFSL